MISKWDVHFLGVVLMVLPEDNRLNSTFQPQPCPILDGAIIRWLWRIGGASSGIIFLMSTHLSPHQVLTLLWNNSQWVTSWPWALPAGAEPFLWCYSRRPKAWTRRKEKEKKRKRAEEALWPMGRISAGCETSLSSVWPWARDWASPSPADHLGDSDDVIPVPLGCRET